MIELIKQGVADWLHFFQIIICFNPDRESLKALSNSSVPARTFFYFNYKHCGWLYISQETHGHTEARGMFRIYELGRHISRKSLYLSNDLIYANDFRFVPLFFPKDSKKKIRIQIFSPSPPSRSVQIITPHLKKMN